MKQAALGILDQAEAEIRQAIRVSGHGDDGFAPNRIREYAGDLERLRDLLPPSQIRDKMQPAVDSMHRLTMLDTDPQDAQVATQLLSIARRGVRDL